MTIDDVLNWIAKESGDTAMRMIEITKKYDRHSEWDNANGACEVLQKLRHHILMKTNPHNREDIKRVNENINLENKIKMENEIIEFLCNQYYHLSMDIDECKSKAIQESFKVMDIIEKYAHFG